MKRFTNIDKFEDYIMEEKLEFREFLIFKDKTKYRLSIRNDKYMNFHYTMIATLELKIKKESDLQKLKDIESLLDEILIKGYE